MKKVIFTALILFCTNFTFAQKTKESEMPMIDGAITYTEIVTVDSVSKDELLLRARAFFNKNVKSLKDASQIMDKETGEISVKCNTGNIPSNSFGFYSIGAGRVSMTIDVYLKDNKYKYVITNFVHSGTAANHNDIGPLESKRSNGMPIKEIKQKTHKIVLDLISDFKLSMTKKAIDDF